MKNLRLKVKLIGGFSLTAVLIVVIGFISIVQQNKLTRMTKIMEEDALAAVSNILTLREKTDEIVIHARTLLSPYLAMEERASVLAKITPLRDDAAAAKERFMNLPFFNRVKPEWQQYSLVLGKWKETNNRAIALSTELVTADIANPERLVRDMQDFEIAHKTLLNKVNGLLFLQMSFTGGTDASQCSLGKWLANMPTSNPQIVTEMEKLRPIHTELHQQVTKIKDLVEDGQLSQARMVQKEELLPLSAKVFLITRGISTLATEYYHKFKQINTILLKDGEQYQASASAALKEIIRKAENYAEQSKELARKTAGRGKTISIICMVVGTILALLLGISLTTMITHPLSRGVELARSMAAGDMTKTLEIDQRDEVGILAGSLNDMAKKLHRMLTSVGKEIGLVNRSSSSLAEISRQMTAGAEETAGRSNQVAAAAEEMSANQNSVAAAMEEAAVNVNMVAVATEEMKSTITEISENSGRAKTITSQAVEKSQTASELVDELGRAAHEINKVTETITEISEQTNLLALNATIEAARAGEAGKGFAVVANEIKALAGQTAEATLDIQEKIQDIQQATNITVKEINDISTVISEIDQVVATIAAAVEEQSATTAEIVVNVTQVSQGITEVNENVAQSTTVSAEIAADVAEVSNRANEMTASSTRVKEMAEELSGIADKLQEMIDRFKV